MENKQPKEVWIGVYEDVKFFASNRPQVIMLPITNTKLAVHNPIKYISETHHIEIVEALKKEIEELKKEKERLGKMADHRTECRNYLMEVLPDNLTVEDCLEALGYGRNGLNF